MALKLVFSVTILASMAFAARSVFQPMSHCPGTCGDLDIPFPFGSSPECYYDQSFFINCDKTHDPPKPFLSGKEVLNISLEHGQMKLATSVASHCYNEDGNITSTSSQLILSRFSVSTRNKFTAIGCDTLALVEGDKGQNYSTGCISLCDSFGIVMNESCSGIGCCQTSIPAGLREFVVNVGSFRNHTRVQSFNPCSYAYIHEEGSFIFSTLDLNRSNNGWTVPLVLEWDIENRTCSAAKTDAEKYACKSSNSECKNSDTGLGYNCLCSSGFKGNPYLIDGCHNINECEVSNPCAGICTDTIGSFSCSCPEGHEGDGLKDGSVCHPQSKSRDAKLLSIVTGVSTSLFVIILGASWVYWIKRKKKLMKLREKFFQQNGGLLLQQKLLGYEGSNETSIIFTAEDLRKATNNYDETRVIGQGGYGTVYKGVLPDKKVIAIKKSKISDQGQIEQFINEVAILSQINHRNVVKLLGCCLETEVPLLVYEFITNGTLFNHIHNENLTTFLSWDMRLKIAAETAGALAYLHSAASVPIIHRDIKTANILLNNTFTAKVSDFGASRLIPLHKNIVTTVVQGTFGYLDPEYFRSSQLTEKSDVYSFGVVLAELLTGRKAVSLDKLEEERSLAMYFVSSVEEGELLHIVQHGLVEKERHWQLGEVAQVAKNCLLVKAEERPKMKEVAMELEGLRMDRYTTFMNKAQNLEETENLLDLSFCPKFRGAPP